MCYIDVSCPATCPLCNFRSPAGLQSFELLDEAFTQLLEMGYVPVSMAADAGCLTCLQSTWVRLPAACWAHPPNQQLGR